jgi:hypothetical protein
MTHCAALLKTDTTYNMKVIRTSKRDDPQASASAVAILKAEVRVHDEAAIGLMRQAQRHLRASVKLDREISKLIEAGGAYRA